MNLASRTPSGVRGIEMLRTWYEGGDHAAILALTEVIERDVDRYIRRAALQGLGRISDEAAIPGLLLGLRESDRRGRLLAASALGRLKAREAVPELIGLLDDRYCRAAATEALATIRDERALQPLREAVSRAPRWRRPGIRRIVVELEAALGYPPAKAG